MTDPRTTGDFAPEHFPLCDGRRPPPGSGTTADSALKLEFLAVYYRLNSLVARLEVERAAGRDPAPTAALLAEAREERDALEDRCAPVGFLAEPVLEGSRVADVRFTTARQAARAPAHHSASFALAAPGSHAGERGSAVPAPFREWKS